MVAKLIILAVFLHSLLAMFYLFAGLGHSVFSNWPLLLFAVSVVLDLLFVMYLRNKDKQQINLSYGWVYSFILLTVPFLAFFLIGLYINI